MARCAASAALAAIEIYNKPAVGYREQTFALLMVNAWEVLLKARLVQQAVGKMAAIYRREEGSRRYQRDSETKEPLTIGLSEVLGRADIPGEVRTNIAGLVEVRNRAAHLGLLAPDTRQAVLAFGTASVQNFRKMSLQWFDEEPEVPFLLPVGFLGQATASGAPSGSQKKLLEYLTQLSESSGVGDSEYAAVMRVDIQINRGFAGGGNIGLTRSPTAPTVRMTDDEALDRFPTSYQELVERCRARYPGFKRNRAFHCAMRAVNDDPQCAYERKLDPKKETSTIKRFYNAEAVFGILDNHYALGGAIEGGG